MAFSSATTLIDTLDMTKRSELQRELSRNSHYIINRITFQMVFVKHRRNRMEEKYTAHVISTSSKLNLVAKILNTLSYVYFSFI